MANKIIACVIILTLAATQFSCVAYIEKTKRTDMMTAETIQHQKNTREFAVLEVVKKSGDRYTFKEGDPGKIEGGVVKGLATIEKSLELASQEIASIPQQSPDQLVALSKKGDTYYFDSYSQQDGVFTGTGRMQTFITIPLDEIEAAWINYKVKDVERGMHRTLRFANLALTAVGFIAVLANPGEQSCPYIYSFDGENYIFDAEPYSGSICRGSQRTEWCRLDHIRPSNGEYRVLATNELQETEFVDELTLLAVDHPAQTTIVPDAWGRLHSISNPTNALSAIDKDRIDVTSTIAAKDRCIWLPKHPLKDELTMRFPKPPHATSAKLIFVGQNTLLGPKAVTSYLDLYGDQIQDFYGEVDRHGPAYYTMLGMHLREELFSLKVRVNTNKGWQDRGLIIGAPPKSSEFQVSTIDLTGVEGETVEIRLTPPANFWRINHIALDYSEDIPLDITEISASRAIDQTGNDVKALLATSDRQYHRMPNTGDEVELAFPVPELKPGTQRTLILRASGYYDIHLGAVGPKQEQLLDKIHNEPGFALKFSQEELSK